MLKYLIIFIFWFHKSHNRKLHKTVKYYNVIRNFMFYITGKKIILIYWNVFCFFSFLFHHLDTFHFIRSFYSFLQSKYRLMRIKNNNKSIWKCVLIPKKKKNTTKMYRPWWQISLGYRGRRLPHSRDRDKAGWSWAAATGSHHEARPGFALHWGVHFSDFREFGSVSSIPRSAHPGFSHKIPNSDWKEVFFSKVCEVQWNVPCDACRLFSLPTSRALSCSLCIGFSFLKEKPTKETQPPMKC